RACIADSKRHIRVFLAEALEELGFITCECAHIEELSAVLDTSVPDLVVLGMSAGGVEAGAMIKSLAANTFDGKLLILGPDDCPPAGGAYPRWGERRGVPPPPPLRPPTPAASWPAALAPPPPTEAPPTPPIDVAEAASAGWLDLWYQPKIDVRTRSFRGAEA